MTRAELGDWNEQGRAYHLFIQAGIEIFWSAKRGGAVSIAGLDAHERTTTTIAETYPRYVIKQLWPDLSPIPSKRKQPKTYVEEVLERLIDRGFSHRSRRPPNCDQVDAMVCAVVAHECAELGGLPPGTVGQRPTIDQHEGLLREGYIVSP
jgi:hypothetical protein